MLFADTVIQIEASTLIAALGAFGAAVGGAIVGAAKLITNKMDQLHADNRADRELDQKRQATMMEVMNQQWAQLASLSRNTQATAQTAQQIKRKVGAGDETS